MPLSQEQKKESIIRTTRAMMAKLCQQAGTQEPLLYLHPNADGTGSLTAIWESTAAVVKTLLPVLPGGQKMMTDSQKLAFVLNGVVKSHAPHHRGVTYTIKLLPKGGGAARAVLTFPTYAKLLDKLYSDSVQFQQQQNMQSPPQQQQPNSIAQWTAMIQRQTEANRLQSMQACGTAPTHYINGVPNYSGMAHFREINSLLRIRHRYSVVKIVTRACAERLFVVHYARGCRVWHFHNASVKQFDLLLLGVHVAG